MKLSKVSMFHYIRMFYRGLVFLVALWWYIADKLYKANICNIFIFSDETVANIKANYHWIMLGVTILFTLEMILRLLPIDFESRGAQKHFKKNYIPAKNGKEVTLDSNAAGIVALVWILGNVLIGELYLIGILDREFMFLVCLFYSVCDMICILFFCPFQTFFLKNRCCNTCRIYNWDYIMMFTPLVFVPSLLTTWLFFMALVILCKWEISAYFFPERFSDSTNEFIRCANCSEKLCTHKKQLKGFWKKLSDNPRKRIIRIINGSYSEANEKEAGEAKSNK